MLSLNYTKPYGQKEDFGEAEFQIKPVNMKKVKITKEQYTKLSESIDVNGGINRVNKTFKKEFSGGEVKNLGEEAFNISKPVAGIPNSKMQNAKAAPAPKPISEEIFNRLKRA